MVLYSTGMRNAELRHLQVRDIDSRRMLIHIQHGKGGRDRYVPLSATPAGRRSACTTAGCGRRRGCFPGTIQNWRADKPITPKVVWDACRDARASAPGWRNGSRPHLLRHSYASHLVEAGADLRTVQLLLGHVKLEHTVIYLHLSQRHLQAVANPLDAMPVSAARHRAPHAPVAQAVTRPPFEVADIVRRHGDRFLETHRAWVTGQHRRVLRAIAQCRTAALGGHRDRCDQCAQPALSYNSCRDRHCPKCLTAARNAWVAAREQELLPGRLRPHRLHDAGAARPSRARQQARGVRPAVSGGRRDLAPGRQQSEAPGWRHRRADGPPHVGPAAAAPSPRPLRRAGGRLVAGWHPVDPRAAALLPPDSRAAAGLSGQARRRLYARPFGRAACHFPGSLAPLATDVAFRAFLRSLYRQPWVVYAKPPFGSPAHVLHYLARYTHRVAISNHRLVAVTDDTVSFRWKDYRHGSQMRTLTLDADEFLRRFLLHVLPKRFVRIRYFGFLASRCRTRELRAVSSGARRRPTATRSNRRVRRTTDGASWPCPRCGAPMRIVERLTARQLFLDALLDERLP